MTTDDLTRMLNQIAAFHRSYPRDEAEEGVATHIRDFWDPAMRASLALLVAAGGAGVDDIALAGARRTLSPTA